MTEWFEASQEPHGLDIGDRIRLLWPDGSMRGYGVITEVQKDVVYIGFPQIGTRAFMRVFGRSRRPGIWWTAKAHKQFGYSYYQIEKGRQDEQPKNDVR